MEIEDKYEELLVKYLLNETSAAENDFISEWISSSEKNKLYLGEIASSLQLISANKAIGDINTDHEWQHFQELLSLNKQAGIGNNVEAVNENKVIPIHGSTGIRKLSRILIASAVAASLIFIVLFGSGVFSNHKDANDKVVKNAGPVLHKTDQFSEIFIQEENTSDKIKMILLPDGSHVNLFSNSKLTYRQPKNRKTREVTLSGKADFKVLHNKALPFMVFSGEIYTTDIGTEFTVTAIPAEKQIIVHLLEGEVVVSPTNRQNGNQMKDTWLEPGQELVYDVASRTAMVRSFKGHFKESRKSQTEKDHPLFVNDFNKPWFMFNNQSLNSTFDVLANMYNVKILYSKEEASKIYFIGTFNKSDSIEFILNQIASVNNMVVIRENNVYTIKQK
jgi:hypothetical protein